MCHGFHKRYISFNQGEENELKADTRLILHDEPFKNKDGNIQWYPDPYYRVPGENTEETVGTFRHADCIRASYIGQIENGICRKCDELPKLHSFRHRLHTKANRVNFTTHQSVSTDYTYLPKNVLINRLRTSQEDLEKQQHSLFLLKSELKRTKQRTKL